MLQLLANKLQGLFDAMETSSLFLLGTEAYGIASHSIAIHNPRNSEPIGGYTFH